MDTTRHAGPRRTPPYFAVVGLVAVAVAVLGTLLTVPAQSAHANPPSLRPTTASVAAA